MRMCGTVDFVADDFFDVPDCNFATSCAAGDADPISSCCLPAGMKL